MGDQRMPEAPFPSQEEKCGYESKLHNGLYKRCTQKGWERRTTNTRAARWNWQRVSRQTATGIGGMVQQLGPKPFGHVVTQPNDVKAGN
jgi:hypothetical protein